jgi:hypothetical protein
VTERARTVSTLVLCVVMVGALAMILLVLPGLDSAPEPTEVSLDFGTFVPGEAQVRTTALDVPTGSVVREAGVAVATGFARDLDVTFELCAGAECRPLAVGDTVAAGAYELRVTALLDAEVAPGTEGRLAGGLLLAESSTSSTSDRSTIVWLATLGLITVVALGAVAHRRRTVMA